MPVALTELTNLGNGYFTRPLSPGRVELYRADGFSFGDTGVEYLEQVIRHDKDRPAPSTGETIKKRFDDPLQPNSAVAADDPTVEVPLPVKRVVAKKSSRGSKA